MQAKYIVQWLILFISGIQTFELFIKNDNDQSNETFKSYANRSYQIPLFQTRFITIRIHPDDLRHVERAQKHDIIGFKFQVQSSDIRVLDVRKEIRTANINKKNNVLLEDLFIRKLEKIR